MRITQDTRCLVTGSTSGLGYELVRSLARDGAHVIMHGRSARSVADAAANIRAALPEARISTVHADLGEANAIGELTAQLPDGDIDLLVNNAGAAFATFGVNAQGIERTVWINHFSPFLLTQAMRPRMPENGIVATVSSAAIGYVSVDPQTADVTGNDLEPGYTQLRAYGVSKLYGLAALSALARREPGQATLILVDPGGIKTDFARKAGEKAFLDMTLEHWEDCVTAEDAAAQVRAAVERDDPVQGGLYFQGKPAAIPQSAHDERFADRILARTEDMIARF